jgi:hypothetical protein
MGHKVASASWSGILFSDSYLINGGSGSGGSGSGSSASTSTSTAAYSGYYSAFPGQSFVGIVQPGATNNNIFIAARKEHYVVLCRDWVFDEYANPTWTGSTWQVHADTFSQAELESDSGLNAPFSNLIGVHE